MFCNVITFGPFRYNMRDITTTNDTLIDTVWTFIKIVNIPDEE